MKRLARFISNDTDCLFGGGDNWWWWWWVGRIIIYYVSELDSDNSHRCPKPGENFLYKLDYTDDLESFGPLVTIYRVA